MVKLEPIEQIAEDIKNKKIRDDNIVMLELDEFGNKHNPVGYIWNTRPLKLYQTSGMAISDISNGVLEKVISKAVDISEGDYLGIPILGYEIVKTAEELRERSLAIRSRRLNAERV